MAREQPFPKLEFGSKSDFDRVDLSAVRHEIAGHEATVASDADSISVPGYCAVCGVETMFLIDYAYGGDRANGRPNFRERLVCARCGLNNRTRNSPFSRRVDRS